MQPHAGAGVVKNSSDADVDGKIAEHMRTHLGEHKLMREIDLESVRD
jgi:hypothetical protein